MPKATGDAIRVEGLAQFLKELKALGAGWPKELGQANKAAADVVVAGARTKAAQRGGPAAHAAPSLASAARAREAVVTFGGRGHPEAMGAEFGSKRYRQFPSFLGNQWEGWGGPGYVVGPAAREKGEAVETVYMAAITRIAARAFPD